MKIKKSILFFVASLLTLTSCLSDKYDDIQNNSTAGFDFSTIKKVNVDISVHDYANAPMKNVLIRLFTQNPLNADGSLKSDCDNYLIYNGTTNVDGKLACEVSPATTVDSLSILVNQIGFPRLTTIAVNSSDITVLFGGASKSGVKSNSGLQKVVSFPTPTLVNGFYTLGTWNNSGVPNYLMAGNDAISAGLLADINATLPEQFRLPKTHPEFFDNSSDGSVKLYEDAEVFVTFVHEGAGWTNMLAYYTYPTATPPATVNDITNKTVIFPNVSFLNSGGGLVSGNKVQLLYLDPVTKTYTNLFPKGTTVAWAFQAQGWANSTVKAVNSNYMWYSNQSFNTESDKTKNQHSVVLNDADRNLLLIGFEDMRRDNGSDEDYNDAVFYATTNPITAINPNDYDKVIKVKDSDEDGVSDDNDDYPNDPTKAHNNYYPAKGQFGTLAFEDLWPSKGDYDFNDAVIDYNYNQITNANNDVVTVEATYNLRAIGATYANGFGIQLNTTPENVVSVTGQKFTDNIVSVAENGTEKNQSKAVVMIYDNSLNILKHSANSNCVNTIVGAEYVTPETFNVTIDLKTPVAASKFGSAPYNPFIFVNKDRTKEVHLPKCSPTDLADLKLFGTEDDNTDVNSGTYYMSEKSLPWALNFPVQFDYPAEKQDITRAFLHFNEWAVSKGGKFADWYIKKDNYRDTKRIYSK